MASAAAGSLREHPRQRGEQAARREANPLRRFAPALPKGEPRPWRARFLSLFRKGTKGILGVLLASPFGRGVTEGDGEGAPAPLRGAAAAAAEGPSNRRNEKNAFSEAASIFPLRPLLWDYQGRAALDSWVQRVEIAGTFLVLFWCQKRTIPARLQRIEIAVPLPR